MKYNGTQYKNLERKHVKVQHKLINRNNIKQMLNLALI